MRSRLGIAALAALLCLGCSSEIVVFVDVLTSRTPEEEFDEVETSIFRDGEETPLDAVTVRAVGDTSWDVGTRVAEFPGLAPGAYAVEAPSAASQKTY